MQLIMRTFQLSCPYGTIDSLVDFGMNPENSETPGACLQNLEDDKFKNKDCSSDTYINRQKITDWFTNKCENQKYCIMNFPEA